jgi:streptogramin lyase
MTAPKRLERRGMEVLRLATRLATRKARKTIFRRERLMRLYRGIAVMSCVVFALGLAGCSTSFDVPPASGGAAAMGSALSGNLHGGQQPLNGAAIYMFAANTTGYGSPSLSVIQPYTCTAGSHCYPSTADANGNYYVTTNWLGQFYLGAGEYACTAGQQVYLYALGGDPGTGPNAAAGLMAVLGTCQANGSFPGVTSVQINEVSTVAAAYAMAGFAVDALHVANDANDGRHTASAAALAYTGMQNAFNTAANLFNVSSGAAATGAMTTTVGGNGTVPQAEINTIADSLAACINSTGPSSPGCSSLLSTVLSGGSTTGTQATDTATAAIYIAHNPGDAGVVAAVLNNVPSNNPFNPIVHFAPTDLSVSIYYPHTGLASPTGVGIDPAGNAWVLSQSVVPGISGQVQEFSPMGVALGTFATGGPQANPVGIAMDAAGNAWITNNDNTLTELLPSGADAVGSPIAVGSLQGPAGVAIDNIGNIDVADSQGAMTSEFTSAGSGIGSLTSAYLQEPTSIALDSTGVMWIGDPQARLVERMNAAGTVLSNYAAQNSNEGNYAGIAFDAAGTAWVVDNIGDCYLHLNASGAPFGTGDTCTKTSLLYEPTGVAVDGTGKVWIANQGGGTLEEITPGATDTVNDFANSVVVGPTGIGIDGSGNVWLSYGNPGRSGVAEFVGIATPSVAPLATAASTGMYGVRP